jgi:hypothetical protein
MFGMFSVGDLQAWFFTFCLLYSPSKVFHVTGSNTIRSFQPAETQTTILGRKRFLSPLRQLS